MGRKESHQADTDLWEEKGATRLTLTFGEEEGAIRTTLTFGEEDGTIRLTLTFGEEEGAIRLTTFGEEDGAVRSTLTLKEEEGAIRSTLTFGEEDGAVRSTHGQRHECTVQHLHFDQTIIRVTALAELGFHAEHRPRRFLLHVHSATGHLHCLYHSRALALSLS